MGESIDWVDGLWEIYLIQQQQLCNRFGVEFIHIEPNQIIGFAKDNVSLPINGLRHPIEENTSGWYIWTGKYSEEDDFFKPIHAWHLLEIKPELINYLGLPPGYRFLIGDDGYEDVWFDSSLLKT